MSRLPILLSAMLLCGFASFPPSPRSVGTTADLKASVDSLASSIRSEIDSLHASMVAAFKREPASVARFYTDDARIIGMGMHRTGREQVNQYWSQGMGATDWILETLDTGGTRDGPWVLGRSTIVGAGGRRMVTEYMGVLTRGSDGRLRYRIDLFTAAQ